MLARILPAALLMLCCAVVTGPVASSAQVGAPRILLFSKTAGFRHGSINTARSAITQAATAEGFVVDATEDASVFSANGLAPYDAVVFMLTSGNVLDTAQQDAFEAYIQAGNGYAGIHSASDTEYNWPWYGDLIGAWFDSHPSIQQATLNVEIADHPSTETLPVTWVRTDEWYNFRTNPRATVNVLITLDETSYNGGNMGSDHPIAWFHDFDGGRSWYTGGGHRSQAYSETEFLAHVMGGIRYAAGLTDEPDTDGDGVADSSDNCQLVPNASQLDTNEDGFGNACDGDFNGDCVVNTVDLGVMRANFFATGANDADLNGDGAVSIIDLGLLRTLFFGTPGPSGVASCEQ